MNVIRSADYDRFSDRENFALSLVLRLSEVMDSTVGPQETEAAIAQVASMLAADLDATLARQRGGTKLDPEQVALVLLELKRRIGGAFRIESIDEEKIVFRNAACPFGARVKGRTSLCRMTSGVFARVAEENLGFGEVDIERSIAAGDGHCHVVLHYRDAASAPTDAS